MLDCLGTFHIPFDASVEEEERKTTLEITGKTLYVFGDIQSGFAEEITNLIAQNTNVETIALGGAGGSTSEAIKAGTMIRSLGLNTALTNNCLSACALVFLGGVERHIWSPYLKLGLHLMYLKDNEALPPSDDGYQAAREYVEAMGVEAKFLMSALLTTEPKAMYFPRLGELCESGIATWVQRICWN